MSLPCPSTLAGRLLHHQTARLSCSLTQEAGLAACITVHHDTDSCQSPACRHSAASIPLFMLQGYLPWVDAVAREIQPDVYKRRAECLVDPVEVSTCFQPVCNGFGSVQVPARYCQASALQSKKCQACARKTESEACLY